MRESRDKIDMEFDGLKPIDITQFGSEDDCFGKEFDLKAEECKVCGDSEFCQVVFAQNAHKIRKQIESKNKFKDIQDINNEPDEKIINFMRAKREKGLSKIKIISKTVSKFKEDKSRIKSIYNQIF